MAGATADRQRPAHRTAIPAGFETVVTRDEHAKAADYAVARQRLGVLETIYDALCVLVLTLGGGIAPSAPWPRGLGRGPGVWRAPLHLLGVFAVLSLLGLPFSHLPHVRARAALRLQPHRPATYSSPTC